MTVNQYTPIPKEVYETQLLKCITTNSSEGIVITDPENNIILVNPAFTEITGYDAVEVIGKNPNILKSNRNSPEFYQNMWESLLKKGSWQGEIWNRRKNGEAYPEKLSITILKDTAGNITNYVAIFHDITSIRKSVERLKYRTYYDALTGLPNRQLLQDRLERAIAYAQRHNQSITVMFLDIDHFKNINEAYGHYTGDCFLQEIGKRIESTCRNEDTVARFGGDEFVLVLPKVKDENDPVALIKRLTEVISHSITLQNVDFFPSISTGIAIFPVDGNDVQSLIVHAETAMYKAKENGRNGYTLFSKSMTEAVLRRNALENGLRNAIKNNEMVLYYQPKVNLQTGEITGSEALVRWRKSEKELIMPNEFIPLAEETGLILPLSEWGLYVACQQTKDWHKAGFNNLTIAVNIPSKIFREADLLSLVRNVLKKTGLPPQFLDIEITERTVMADVEKAVKIMNELVMMGVKISIDDFGTGYSSLSYLKKFPIHLLKIDRSFIMDIPESNEDMIIAKTIISMAHSLGINVIAEGVETPQQLEFLQTYNCEEMQGFLFSKAVPPEDFMNILTEGRKLEVKPPSLEPNIQTNFLFIQWDEKYSVKNKMIDSQHKTIINLINSLFYSSNSNAHHSVLNNIFESLTEYTQVHFRDEEYLMKINNYPNYNNHKTLHENLLLKTLTLKNEFRKTKDDLREEVFNFLKLWWIGHITNEDQKYITYIK